MDSLNLLRDARPTDADISPEAFTASRAHLMNAINGESQGATAPARRRERRRLGRGAAGKAWAAATAPRRSRSVKKRWVLAGAAAAAAAGLVVTQMALPIGLVGSPDTAAAATLNRAAENAVRFSDPVLVAGQFLKVEDLSTHPTDIGVTEYSNGERTDRGVLVKYTERGTRNQVHPR